MKNLLQPGIQCTDPDSLQFCLRISESEYWYCQPNIYHRDLFPGADTPAQRILCRYLGDPNDFLRDIHSDDEVRAFASDRMLWLEGEIDAADFSREEQEELLDAYGYRWESFFSDAERNQIICENHFEQYPLDYRNDI
ncbi:hypothetical protein [Alistipes sp.]|uniref:hypothetical protein n=1 Tax=Alistipes sp. TaxID=1872444 RepID=UPI003AF778CF